jgi:hypothetical protein
MRSAFAVSMILLAAWPHERRGEQEHAHTCNAWQEIEGEGEHLGTSTHTRAMHGPHAAHLHMSFKSYWRQVAMYNVCETAELSRLAPPITVPVCACAEAPEQGHQKGRIRAAVHRNHIQSPLSCGSELLLPVASVQALRRRSAHKPHQRPCTAAPRAAASSNGTFLRVVSNQNGCGPFSPAWVRSSHRQLHPSSPPAWPSHWSSRGCKQELHGVIQVLVGAWPPSPALYVYCCCRALGHHYSCLCCC